MFRYLLSSSFFCRFGNRQHKRWFTTQIVRSLCLRWRPWSLAWRTSSWCGRSTAAAWAQSPPCPWPRGTPRSLGAAAARRRPCAPVVSSHALRSSPKDMAFHNCDGTGTNYAFYWNTRDNNIYSGVLTCCGLIRNHVYKYEHYTPNLKN